MLVGVPRRSGRPGLLSLVAGSDPTARPAPRANLAEASITGPRPAVVTPAPPSAGGGRFDPARATGGTRRRSGCRGTAVCATACCLPAYGRDYVHMGTRRSGAYPNCARPALGDRAASSRRLLFVLQGYHRAHPHAPPVLVGGRGAARRAARSARATAGLGHASHQNGLDVDVLYPRRDGKEPAGWAARHRPPARSGPGQPLRRRLRAVSSSSARTPGCTAARAVVETLVNHDDPHARAGLSALITLPAGPCPSRPKAVGKDLPARRLRGRAREDPRVRARHRRDPIRSISTPRPRARRGYADVVCAADVSPVRLLRAGDGTRDPRSRGRDETSPRWCTAGQEFRVGPHSWSRETRSRPSRASRDVSERGGMGFYNLHLGLDQPARRGRCAPRHGPTS